MIEDDQPLELALRPGAGHGNFVGGCYFGLSDSGKNHSGACRKDPDPDSAIGLCPEHLAMMRSWSDGDEVADPRPNDWTNRVIENASRLFPDLYIGNRPIDA